MAVVSKQMSRDVLTVEPDVGLREAAKRMCDRRVGSAIVTEGGRMVGIVTERDVLRAFADGVDPGERVGALMTRDPDTIGPEDTTEHATTLMLHGGFRHLPVVESGDLVGILSIRDVVELAAGSPSGV
jgi:CBS domain-containing protein